MIKLFRKTTALLPAITALLTVLAFSPASGSAAPERAAALFDQARSRLAQANAMGTAASGRIVEANSTRKHIRQLRAQLRRTQDTHSQQQLIDQTDNLLTQLQQAQASGSELRKNGKARYYEALNLFEQGAVARWPTTITNRGPLSMDDATSLFIAHNTAFRSVHPNMLNKMGTPADNIDRSALNKKMSILVPALAEQNAPKNLDIRSFQLSRDQQYLAHIEVKADAGDPARPRPVPFNRIHRWTLLVSDLWGQPVSGAQIEVLGHMPGHVHGLPTQPRVTAELAPGIYEVDGLKFQMKGWWVMQFNIVRDTDDAAAPSPSSPGARPDSVVFNLVL